MKNGTPRAVWLEREPYTYENTYEKETYMCAKKPTYVQKRCTCIQSGAKTKS